LRHYKNPYRKRAGNTAQRDSASMPTVVRSHAKINLGLGIGAPRPDGFHALTTVYQTLEMHDLVTITARAAASNSIRLTSNDGRVPTDGRNTAWKMVELALGRLSCAAEVAIHIEKRLPVQGGLGAGSANAVAAWVGLERELGKWQGVCGLPALKSESWASQRLEIAAQVGSDVPLFLIGGAILGLDRGQQVYPLPDFEPVWCLVATPSVGVSTPQAFRDWDALCLSGGLTAEASTDKLNMLSRAYASAFAGAIPRGAWEAGSSGVLSGAAGQFAAASSQGKNLAGPFGSALVRTGITNWIQNDFEQVVFPQHPSLAEIKRTLAASGTPEAALHASLSGSGSALFGLYRTREDAETAQERLRELEVASHVTRTLPRETYWCQMVETTD
jgi:4-diphosphocytidyl-2-C-methyl-D-erythritol kinase